MDKYRVLNIAAEATPFSNVGGLSNVIPYLSKSLIKKGHDVRIFMPKFGFIDESKYKLELIYKGLKIPTKYKKDEKHPQNIICNIKQYVDESGVVYYFLENMDYYEMRSNVYNYSDDHIRWTLLCEGALRYILKESEWKPNVIHCHDWHTSLTPNILKKDFDSYLKDHPELVTVLTIHNISFQGHQIDTNSQLNFDDGKSDIPRFFSERLKTLNFLKRGIIYSDIINTVSEGYARQILTPEYGVGLDKLLLELRSKLFGIINGVDYDKFNTEKDPLLEFKFNANTLEKRVGNKLRLQKEFGLGEDENKMIFSFVGRLDYQKGVDLMLEVLDKFLKDFDAQFVLIGSGDKGYEKSAQMLAAKYKGRVGAHTYANFSLPKLVFGGSDSILLPSRFEPCGIVQMEAMRYGTVPIVKATGGLDDTVIDFDPETLLGNGFKFKEFDGWSLYGQMVRAFETYRNKKVWKQIQKNAMEADFSWDKVAEKYVDLYDKAVYFKKEKFFERIGSY